MAAPPTTEKKPVAPAGTSPALPAHQPYVPDSAQLPEFTLPAVLTGIILGIVFGASSLYLVLKVGMTVSASIPVAVLSITVFRGLAKAFNMRPATILENNIVQTTGSAGESIAFGVGVTIPALLLLGFDMTAMRVMTVGTLGGLLGILMMIPLRRAFIVQQHGKLRYPEGTACADVLIVGEEGGATAKTVFAGFTLAFMYKLLMKAMGLWKEDVGFELYNQTRHQGLKGAVLGAELSPELLGVGYIIGPRIGSIMMSGGVLAWLVIVPMIMLFGSGLRQPLAPATDTLIRGMSVGEIRNNYILYIGAGAVATGGIISMFQALPMIIGSLRGAWGDLATSSAGAKGKGPGGLRTSRDLPLWLVICGSLGLVLALAATPSLGLGFTIEGLAGAVFIVLFGFLFVMVSSRLTGEIGSSSNPISGMTVATLLLTCLGFIMLGHTGKAATLTALTVAAVVCIAASNGGTTSQDLKTGYLVGATPRLQQLAILIGALTSAAFMGGTLLLLNSAGTIYTRKPAYLPRVIIPDVKNLTHMEPPGGEYGDKNSQVYDAKFYHVLQVGQGEVRGVPAGKYLVDGDGRAQYYVDPAINGRLNERDDGSPVANKFEAPKTRLMALIIDGMLNGKLPWELVLIGALLAVVLELAGVPSLPFAVGVYLPIQVSSPIFLGGMVRWFVDKISGSHGPDAETSPGVLLSSGYIAGGSIGGVLLAFSSFSPKMMEYVNFHGSLSARWNASDLPSLTAFGVLMFILALAGLGIAFKAAGSQRARTEK
ncbi:MAG TPA: oligopeptide transporter, OPT family [Pirellulales bacterium]|jgi:putative OPT family oligopeptide transporter|nr:oligopeptide transporter, OPT family [Pirellulales bacterium]